jgi:hypothetical protein
LKRYLKTDIFKEIDFEDKGKISFTEKVKLLLQDFEGGKKLESIFRYFGTIN